MNKKTNEQNNVFKKSISIRETLEKNNKNKILAERLLNGELKSKDLTEEEIEEMIKYFEKYIEEKDKEINNIKNNIIDMRRKVNE